jgi:hypothetical protein
MVVAVRKRRARGLLPIILPINDAWSRRSTRPHAIEAAVEAGCMAEVSRASDVRPITGRSATRVGGQILFFAGLSSGSGRGYEEYAVQSPKQDSRAKNKI